MSIHTGKGGYDSVQEFAARTKYELDHPDSELFRKDTQPPPHEVAYVLDSLMGHKHVLELGSGLGVWGPVAMAAGCETYLGIDPVPERVAFARQHYGKPGKVSYLQGDARDIVIGVSVWGQPIVDAVLFVTVLQHMTLPDATAALKTAVAHLQPGGEVILLESRIWDVSEEECERRYASEDCAEHMIPKPLGVLQAAIPELAWRRAGEREDRWILTRHDAA